MIVVRCKNCNRELSSQSGKTQCCGCSNMMTLVDDVITANTASTNKISGAVVVTGGVGISGALNVGGDITAFSSSDVSLKENITPISNAVDKVRSISGNTFTWNEKSVYNGEEGTGIIAQEIEALELPGVTETRQDGTKAVRYDRLVPLLIEAIKELDGKVKSLEK